MIRKQSGFTIIELLVVIAIIGILVALLMPAIQSARESARQATCQNSLKQMGTAVGSHVGTLNRYPAGGWGYMWLGDPDQGNGQEQPGSWIYNLLPYMDQQILHDFGALPFPANPSTPPAPPLATTITEASWREGGNVIRMMTPMPVFNCPSRRRAANYPYYTQDPTNPTPAYTPLNMVTTAAFVKSTSPTTGYAPPNYCYTSTGTTLLGGSSLPPPVIQPLSGGIARSDYAINSGDTNIGASPTPAPSTLCEPPTGPATPSTGLGPASVTTAIPSAATYQLLFLANTGVSFQQSMVQPAHITDGTAYTMLVGEKSMRPERYTNPSALAPGDNVPMGDMMSMYMGASFDIIRTTSAAPMQDTLGFDGSCSFCKSNPVSNANFGSAHPNGVFFVFCDSSVRLIKYGISPTIYRALSNRFDSTQGYGGTGQSYPPTIDDSLFR